MRSQAIFGCSGPELTSSERDFFAEARPWGFILFARNLEEPSRIRRLTDALRATVGDANAPILIDQEGGRVSRLKPPLWKKRYAAGEFGDLFRRSPEDARVATYLSARLIARDLTLLGINVNCAPVLDVALEGASQVIGDRSFGKDTARIIWLGRAAIEGYLEGGVVPVMKHAPGHGRAAVDSHTELPRVHSSIEDLSTTDFVTFRSLNHCPMAMTAHVVYEALDPVRPATTSPKVIRDVIRNEIGFDGLLISDDISMGALSGPVSVRTKAALFAGCDIVLHCNGDLAEMAEVASEAKPLEGASLRRAEQSMSHLPEEGEFDPESAERRLDELMGESGDR
jgi:beta-N-acetylhexosaminidase